MSQREGNRLCRGRLAVEERPVRKQGWLEAGKDVRHDPDLEPEIAAHARETVEGILDSIEFASQPRHR